MSEPKFELGTLVATPDAIQRAEKHGINLRAILRRHLNGDWGDLDVHDKRVNDQALKSGDRILSAYGEGMTDAAVTDDDQGDHALPPRAGDAPVAVATTSA